MKTSTLVLTIVGSSLLSAVATSALWMLADGLRPSTPVIYVRLANPATPPAAPVLAAVAAPAAAAAAPETGAAPVLVAPGAALPDDVEPPLATAPPAASSAVPAPAPAPLGTDAEAPSASTPAVAVVPVATPEPASASATEMAPAPVVNQAPAPAPVTTDEQGEAAGDDGAVAVGGGEPATEIVYRDTYVSYLGYDAIQINTIPWYCRRFHLAEDEVLCICFIARAAQVPFGTAIVTYVQECGSSCQALLGYYHLSPLIFFITPADDLRFPAPYQRPYRWLRDGGQAPVRFSNQEYQDLLALKLSTDYLRAAPQDFFAVAEVSTPLHLMRGAAPRHQAPIATHADEPAPAEAAPLEEPPLRTEPLEPAHGWAHAPQAQPSPSRPGALAPPYAIPAAPAPAHATATAVGGVPGSGLAPVTPGH